LSLRFSTPITPLSFLQNTTIIVMTRNFSSSVEPDVEHSDDDDAASDASSELTELDREEFPAYFVERDGRLFPSHGGPYPLPVDGLEQGRLNLLHELLKELLRGNYVGPVKDILLNNGSRSRLRVLDLCTGTGQWVLDMASEFPHVKFTGLDTVPIMTRHPPRHVYFEMHDVTTPFRFKSGSFDFVHARQISGMTSDRYALMLSEASRVLRPGGLLLLGEWAHNLAILPLPSSNSAIQQIPATSHYYDVVNECMRITELVPNRIKDLLRRMGAFGEVHVESYVMPIGDWNPDPRMRTLGTRFCRASEMLDSLRPLLREKYPDRDVELWIRSCRDEMGGTRGMVAVYYAIWTRRL